MTLFQVIINIMSYLYGADRKAAGQVSSHWREASLDTKFINKQIVSLTQGSAGDNLRTVMHILRNSSRPFYNFVFKDVELRRMESFWERFGSGIRSLILV